MIELTKKVLLCILIGLVIDFTADFVKETRSKSRLIVSIFHLLVSNRHCKFVIVAILLMNCVRHFSNKSLKIVPHHWVVISTDYYCYLPIHHYRHDRTCLDQLELRQVAIILVTFVLRELPSPANLHQRQRHVMRDVMIHVTRRTIVYAPSFYFYFSGYNLKITYKSTYKSTYILCELEVRVIFCRIHIRCVRFLSHL